jgi:hypothetical protein
MNGAAAWSVTGVGLETRDAAQDAARRCGMSLGEWLEEVIAELAAAEGVNLEDCNHGERTAAASNRLSGFARSDEPSAKQFGHDGDSDPEELPSSTPSLSATRDGAQRAKESLDAGNTNVETRSHKSEERIAWPFSSLRTWKERRAIERETLETIVARIKGLEELIASQFAAANRVTDAIGIKCGADGEPTRRDEPADQSTRRIETSDMGRQDALQAPSAPLQLNGSVAYAPLRRQLKPERNAWRKSGVETPRIAQTDRRPAKDFECESAATDSLASARNIELAKQAQRPDEPRREQSEQGEASRDGAVNRSPKNDRLAPTNADHDTSLLERTLREISAKLGRPRSSAGPTAFDGALHDDGAVDRRRANARIDSESRAQPPHRLPPEIRAQPDQTRQDHGSAQPTSMASADEILVRGLAHLWSEHSESDRRVQSTLGSMHKMLETIVGRIRRIEEDIDGNRQVLRHADAA